MPDTPIPTANSIPVPCYVSGKGMHATQATWSFKTRVIEALETSGKGYDTRYRYYRHQFPDMAAEALARLICDPIEYYDLDWRQWRAARGDAVDDLQAVTEFMLERDHRFRNDARAAIYCYDEAGFGSGVNSMRFLTSGRPILGFYHHGQDSGALNFSNVLQLGIDYPDLFTLLSYDDIEEIAPAVLAWLDTLPSA